MKKNGHQTKMNRLIEDVLPVIEDLLEIGTGVYGKKPIIVFLDAAASERLPGGPIKRLRYHPEARGVLMLPQRTLFAFALSNANAIRGLAHVLTTDAVKHIKAATYPGHARVLAVVEGVVTITDVPVQASTLQ